MKDRPPLGDVPIAEFRRQLHRLADWIADYRETIGEIRVAPNNKPGAIRAALPAQPPEHGQSFENILADVDRLILPGMVHWSHPMFLGYFGWTATAPGLLGEIITAPLNVNAMTWRTSPAATELETVVIDWLRQWMGLPDQFDGVVYDTASVGIMHALAVAREEAAPSTRKRGLIGARAPVFRVYASDQAHSSAEKAAIALGLGEDNVQRVPSDAEFRLDAAALRAMIKRDVAEKFKPLAVVATVGTTSTASVDPVREIAKICREYEMWLHIDGAYGAGLALLPECESVTAGWNEADSIVVNPHKMLFVPFDFSALYMRDIGRLRRLFTLVPEYLHLRDPDSAEINYMDYGVQLGRRFRALKAWVVWRAFGREGIAARIRDHLRLAKLFAEWVRNDKRFELAAPVSMGVVCFRLVTADPDKIDNLNTTMVERINASGSGYITQTKLRERTVMRIGLGNILTIEQHLRNVWELIKKTAEAL